MPKATLTAKQEAKQKHQQLKRQGQLGSGMFLLGKGRSEARAPKSIEKTASTPTPERQIKSDAAHGWDEQQHPGGQVSYRMRSAVDVYREHFTDDLVHAAEDLVRDAELCTRANVICARTYTGMPYPTSVPIDSLTNEQFDAQARFKWIMGRMDERFSGAITFLVLGVRGERMTGPRDFAESASRYRDPGTKNAFTAGFLKAVLIRVKEGQMAYAAHLRWQQEQVKARARLAPQTLKSLA